MWRAGQAMTYVDNIVSLLPTDVKDKPGFPLQMAQLQLLQEQVLLLQDILKELKTMAKKEKPAMGKGKMKKCANCGKEYKGEKCSCGSKPSKGKPGKEPMTY